MPKVTMKFNLPEEETELNQAMHGTDAHYVLCELDQKLRNKLKHGDLTEEAHKELQELRDLLREECFENGINLNE